MKITVDQLIEVLEKAKLIGGGHAPVYFWQDIEHHFEFNPSVFDAVDRKFAGGCLSFEIDRVDEED